MISSVPNQALTESVRAAVGKEHATVSRSSNFPAVSFDPSLEK
jgi:hypothetical protein